jgi:hypothetical protein
MEYYQGRPLEPEELEAFLDRHGSGRPVQLPLPLRDMA